MKNTVCTPWKLMGLLVSLSMAAGATSARAEETQLIESASDGPAIRASVTVLPMFAGQIDISQGIFPGENEAATALAVAPAIDVALGEYFYVGLAPQLINNVQKKLGGPTHLQLDLSLRLGVLGKLGERVSVFSHLLPGYSVLKLEDDDSNPHGVLLGFATGVMVNVTSSFFASGEMGYQFGRHVARPFGSDASFNTRYLRAGLGIGLRL
ncbi:MAG TPA: hypothetical protein VGG33_23980 [Polyangia bacterium]